MAEQSLFPHCNGNYNIDTIFIPNCANVIFQKNHTVFWFDRKRFQSKPPKQREKYIKVYVCSPYMTNESWHIICIFFDFISVD